MNKAVITGSFNPVTEGHIYLLEQALKLFDKVYMCMLINPDKVYELSRETRLDLLNNAVKGYNNAEVAAYDGYAADYCKSVEASVMVRGIRDSKDLAYELDLRQQNLDYGNIDTILLITDDSHRYISSTAVRHKIHD